MEKLDLLTRSRSAWQSHAGTHLCSQLKISLKNTAEFLPTVVSFLGNCPLSGLLVKKLKRSSRSRLGLPVPDLEPAAAPSLPQFSSSVKWESSFLIFPDSQWECEGQWDGVSLPSLPCLSAAHTSLPEGVGKGCLPLTLEFCELGKESRAHLSDHTQQTCPAHLLKFRFLGPIPERLSKLCFWT